jgi:hypothetical protein
MLAVFQNLEVEAAPIVNPHVLIRVGKSIRARPHGLRTRLDPPFVAGKAKVPSADSIPLSGFRRPGGLSNEKCK